MASRIARNGNRSHPDKDIHNLLVQLNEEQHNANISGLFEERWKGLNDEYEGLKRKWEQFTGVQIPKRLKTSSEPPALFHAYATTEVVEREVAHPNNNDEADSKPPAEAEATIVEKPHPDDDLDVSSMIVAELRKQLKRRGLDTRGKKVELQERLESHLKEAKEKRDAAKKEAAEKARRVAAAAAANGNGANSTNTSSVRNAVKEIESKKKLGKADECKDKPSEKVVAPAENSGTSKRGSDNIMDVDMEEVDTAKCMDSNDSINLEHAEMNERANAKTLPGKMTGDGPAAKDSAINAASKTSTNEAIMEESECTMSEVKKTAPKSALKPSKYATMAQGTPVDAKSTSVSKLKSTTAQKQISSTESRINGHEQLGASSASITKTTASTGAKKQNMPLRAQTPNGAAKTMGQGSLATQEKRKEMAAEKEARRKRIAEMREKAKPQIDSSGAAHSSTKTPVTSAKKYDTSSTLKAMATSSTTPGYKSNKIIDQMREKANAVKAAETMAAPMGRIVEDKKLAVKPVASSSGLSSSKYAKVLATPQGSMKSTALKNIVDPSNKPQEEKEKEKEKPLSPLQTYEMSDREEESSDSEEESDDESEQKPKKAIPVWAQKPNLMRALEKQFADGPTRLDPDKIFGEVLTCNLEEIFDKKKARYKKRTSSGNWTRDHVTMQEKLTYKRTMGY